MLIDGIAYEITIEMPARHGDRFDEWFPNVVLDWTIQPDVRGFRVFRGVDADSVRIRLVFTFDSMEDWERFVQRGAHRERMRKLESVAADVDTALWEPGAVTLQGDGSAIVEASGEAAAVVDADEPLPEEGAPIDPSP